MGTKHGRLTAMSLLFTGAHFPGSNRTWWRGGQRREWDRVSAKEMEGRGLLGLRGMVLTVIRSHADEQVAQALD